MHMLTTASGIYSAFGKLERCLMLPWKLGRNLCWVYKSWWQRVSFSPSIPLELSRRLPWSHPWGFVFGSSILVSSPSILLCHLFSTHVSYLALVNCILLQGLSAFPAEQDILRTPLTSHCLCSSPSCGMISNQSECEVLPAVYHLPWASEDGGSLFQLSSHTQNSTKWESTIYTFLVS